jgi:hypothetical protein
MKTAFAFSIAMILLGMVWRIHNPHTAHYQPVTNSLVSR